MFPDSQYMRGFVLIGQKGQEVAEGDPGKRWKGRFVGQGNWIVDARGKKGVS